MMERLSKTADSILWWTYQRGERWKGVIMKRVTFLGWAVLSVTLVSGVFGTDVVHNALGFLFFLGGLMLLVDLLSLFFKRTRLTIDYSGVASGVVTVGQTIHLPFIIIAGREEKRLHCALYPWTRGVSLAEFTGNREPGEGRRNFVDRFLKFYRWKWLSQKKQEPFVAVSSPELHLSAGPNELSLPVQFLQRGCWSLVNMRVHLPGVFGLFERSCKSAGARGEVYVAPQILPVKFLSGGRSGVKDTLSLKTHVKVGDSQEFLSLREYRLGDSWRKMNWKAMARTGKAMIQETEEPGVLSYLIMWDTAGSTEEEFEIGARLMASLVMHLYSIRASGDAVITHGTSCSYSWAQNPQALLRCLAGMKREEKWIVEKTLTFPQAKVYAIQSVNHPDPSTAPDAVELLLSNKAVNGSTVGKEFHIYD